VIIILSLHSICTVQAHSTAYLLGACRPRTVLIDEIQFKRPVEVGDLLRFRSWVLSAKATPKVEEPDRALVHVQVQAAVTKPEALESYETNTFNFLFAIKRRKVVPDGDEYLPMPTMLPGNEEEALQMCLFYGPESRERWGESEFNDQESVR
jgi:acyl-coenzyme A thioesterase 9